MKRFVFVAMVAAALAAAPKAEGALITGSISFSGSANPTGPAPTNWANATGVNFVSAAVSSAPLPSGAYAGTQGTLVTFTDFTFNPFPAGGVVPLWTFTIGLTTYSFDLASPLTLVSAGGGPDGSTLILGGTGTLHLTGFQATQGTFLFTAQGFGNLGDPDATFSFSSSDTALRSVVPEPGSMLLLGTGLLGLAAFARRRMRKA